MNEGQAIEDRLEQLVEEVNEQSKIIDLASIHINERLKAIERLMLKIERKLIDQEKILSLLSENELIDRLVTRKYHNDRIEPMHLQTEEYQTSSIKAMSDDDEQ